MPRPVEIHNHACRFRGCEEFAVEHCTCRFRSIIGTCSTHLNDRAGEWDYHICPQCGTEYDRYVLRCMCRENEDLTCDVCREQQHRHRCPQCEGIVRARCYCTTPESVCVNCRQQAHRAEEMERRINAGLQWRSGEEGGAE